jgi:hypothetical protein
MNRSLAIQDLVDRSSCLAEKESIRFRIPREARTIPVSKKEKQEYTISSIIPGERPPFV